METALLRKAIESKDLTRQGILNAKLHLGEVNLGGLVPPLDYTPALGPASRMTEIGKVDPGAVTFLKTVTPFLEGAAARGLQFTTAG
jgi:hypothetical protein